MSRSGLVVIIILTCLFAEANDSGDSFPKVLIVKAFDASSLQVRKNKKDLFRELTDSLQAYLINEVTKEFGFNLSAVAVPGLVEGNDSSILSLMRINQASNAIVIRALEVYFDEGGETHVEEYGSSPKVQTNYNLCSKVDYSFYRAGSASQQKQVIHCDYFTTRSVNDKAFVIKFGPDIVGKKRHTYGAIERNGIEYIQSLDNYFDKPTSQ